MKFLNCAVLVIVLIATISQKTLGAPAPENAAVAANDDLEPSVAADASEENIRFRKAAPSAPPAPSGKSAYGPVPVAYGPASVPAPAISYSYQVPAPTVPCAKNLLFSCQPSVAAVPCGAQVPYYGSAPVAASGGPVGAYSEPAPQWAVPAAYPQQYGVIPTVREVVYGY